MRAVRSRGGVLFEGSYTGGPDPGRAKWLALGISVAAIALVGLFVGGEYLQRLVRYLDARVPQGVVPAVSLNEPAHSIFVNTLSEVPVVSDQLVADGLPVYDLRMEPKHWQRLQTTARIVTARVIADEVTREYVPAEFWRAGEWTPIQVKLRGLYSPHYLMKRPSLRLKFPADRLFERKRQINLLDPYDKGLTADVTTNWELRRHGIMTWDSRFVVVRLNGEVLGLYQEIEQFGRSLPDRHGRPEGFILSGRGEFYGKPAPGYDKAKAAFLRMAQCHLTPPSPLCNWDLLQRYFDIDRWAWTGGMKFLLQSHHGWATDNLRVFWDPALGHFEPIPWDYQIFPVLPDERPDGEVRRRSYPLSFASIPEYRRLRDQRFWYLATERVEPMIAEADRLFEELRAALSHDLRHLSLATDVDFHRVYRDTLRNNSRTLIALFRDQQLGVRWWPPDASGLATLDPSNQGKAFVVIRAAIILRDGRRQNVELPEPLLVDGSFYGAPGRATARLALLPGDKLVGLVARNGVTGAELLPSEIDVFAKQGRAPEVPPRQRDSEMASGAMSLAALTPGLRVEPGRIVIGPGRVDLFRTLEVDASRNVVLAPGLDLRLAKGVSLIAYGDFDSLGTAHEPIRISGAEGWGGVLVLGHARGSSRVRVEHTSFTGGVGGETERVRFTAPLAVHGGVVRLRQVSFIDGRADDALNLKYAEVDLADIEIRGALDDAFDCDFCRGTVRRVAISDIGGDGLDFSGSDLSVADTTVAHCGDKGISLGEATRARLTQIRVEDCYTGIAVKDLSEADVRDVWLSRLEVGVSLYVKKPTFGPSQARVEGARLRDVATRVLRDESCALEWAQGS